MQLQNEVRIDAAPDRGFAFFAQMHENYLRWHPDHLLFEWRGEPGLAVGRRCYFEERIAGKLYRKEMRFTEILPDRRIRFVPVGLLLRSILPWITFEFMPQPGGQFQFRQSLRLRIGPIAAWLNRRDLDAVRRHMAEEGDNLKSILETGAPVHVRRA